MQPAQLAPRREVYEWFKISATIMAVMLIGVTIAGTSLPGDPSAGANSFLLGRFSVAPMLPWIDDAVRVLANNTLVLMLHFLCALVGAIISRPFKPLPRKLRFFKFLHFELPKWMADTALAYAYTVTVVSIVVQTIGIGFGLAGMAEYTGLESWELMMLTLPHAPLELVAVFLPLGLFIRQVNKGELKPLNGWCWQALVIGFVLLAAASVIEATFSPQLFEQAIEARGGPQFDFVRDYWRVQPAGTGY